jgi:hypothetical protein
VRAANRAELSAHKGETKLTASTPMAVSPKTRSRPPARNAKTTIAAAKAAISRGSRFQRHSPASGAGPQ